MLVLSRKTQQSIVIAGQIRVTIQAIQGGRVRLGIEAPREMPVHRGEVAEQIAKADAASDSDADSDVDEASLSCLLDTDYDLECCEV